MYSFKEEANQDVVECCHRKWEDGGIYDEVNEIKRGITHLKSFLLKLNLLDFPILIYFPNAIEDKKDPLFSVTSIAVRSDWR